MKANAAHSSEVLSAASSEQALIEPVALQEAQINQMMAPYEPRSATVAWFDTLRAVGECINLITVDWGEYGFERTLFSLPVARLSVTRAWLGERRNRANLIVGFGCLDDQRRDSSFH